MNAATAMRELIDRPLVFGDAKQIAAHEYLSQFEEAKEKFTACTKNHDRDNADSCRCIKKYSYFVRQDVIRWSRGKASDA